MQVCLIEIHNGSLVLFIFALKNVMSLVLLVNTSWISGVMKRAACCQPRKRQMSTVNQTALFSVDVDHCTFLGINEKRFFYIIEPTLCNLRYRPWLLPGCMTPSRVQFSTWLTVGSGRSTSIFQRFSSRPEFLLKTKHALSQSKSASNCFFWIGVVSILC